MDQVSLLYFSFVNHLKTINANGKKVLERNYTNKQDLNKLSEKLLKLEDSEDDY